MSTVTVRQSHARRIDREWLLHAVAIVRDDQRRQPATPLLPIQLPERFPCVIFFKDESEQPTGSLKHRLARALLLRAICSGWVTPDTPLVEASSGSTAISLAYFARLLDLKFIAVMPAATSPEKIIEIERLGGECTFAKSDDRLCSQARTQADAVHGHYVDQFTQAERALGWTGDDTLAAEILRQLSDVGVSAPDWFVVGAGTGGTATTIGRHVRYAGHASRLAVVDPDQSRYFRAFAGDLGPDCLGGSRIEGIGRPCVEPSFLPSVIDRMLRVPDAASLGAMRVVSYLLGKRVGPSTGTNFYGVLQIAQTSRRGARMTIASLVCDTGDRYAQTYYDDRWLEAHGLSTGADHHEARIREMLELPDRT